MTRPGLNSLLHSLGLDVEQNNLKADQKKKRRVESKLKEEEKVSSRLHPEGLNVPKGRQLLSQTRKMAFQRAF